MRIRAWVGLVERLCIIEAAHDIPKGACESHRGDALGARSAGLQYRFSYIPTSIRGKWPGAWHAAEIPFVFDTVRAHYGAETSAADETMAREMQIYWVAFARLVAPIRRASLHARAMRGAVIG